MFYRGTSLLTRLASPDALPAPRVPAAAMEPAKEAAQRAMLRELPSMRLSERLADPAGWNRVQRGRRQALEALMPLTPEKPELTRVNDLVCMIAEESSWSAKIGPEPFDDEGHPDIDFQCAETAMLLAWLARSWGEALPSRTQARIVHEARRRVFSPFLAHGDYPFMRGHGHRPLCIFSDILLSAILLEDDDSRRTAILKQALRQLDAAVDARAKRVQGLSDALADTAAITDLCVLLRKLTRGQLDLTADYPTPEWLDNLLFPWIDGPYFVDPAGMTLTPGLSGAEIFRVGLSANDEALTALGARLHHVDRTPSATVTGRLLDMGHAALLAAETGRVPRLKYAATAQNRAMAARLGPLTCALHTGGGRGNAGGFLLFCGSRPILVETSAAGASVPVIAGQSQDANALTLPAAGDFAARDNQEQLTVELTHAYPVSAMVESYQRTVLTMRREGVLRLVDAIELSQSAPVTFRFITPEKPEPLGNGLRLGPVEFAWEMDCAVKAVQLTARFPEGAADGRPLYRLELTPRQTVTRDYFGFTFSCLEA